MTDPPPPRSTSWAHSSTASTGRRGHVLVVEDATSPRPLGAPATGAPTGTPGSAPATCTPSSTTTLVSPTPRSAPTSARRPRSASCDAPRHGSPTRAWSSSACCPTTGPPTDPTPGARPAPSSPSPTNEHGPTDPRPTARTLPPHPGRRLGLRPVLRLRRPAPSRLARLAALLQSPPSPLRHRRPATSHRPDQRPWTSHQPAQSPPSRRTPYSPPHTPDRRRPTQRRESRTRDTCERAGWRAWAVIGRPSTGRPAGWVPAAR